MNNDNYDELKKQFIHTTKQLVGYGKIISPEYAGLIEFDSCDNIQVLVEFIICSYLKAPEADIREALTKEKPINALRVVWQTYIKNKYAAPEPDISDLKKTMTALQEQIEHMKDVMVTQNELEHGIAAMLSAGTAEPSEEPEYHHPKAERADAPKYVAVSEEAPEAETAEVKASEAEAAEEPEPVAPVGEPLSVHQAGKASDMPPEKVIVPESDAAQDDKNKEQDTEPQEQGSQINFNGNLVSYISRLKRKGFDAEQIDFFLECVRDGYTMKQLKVWERKDWSVSVLRRLREIYEEKQRQKKVRKRKKG